MANDMKATAIAIALIGACWCMKATNTLIFYDHRQHAERFVECTVGRWPNVHSVFYRKTTCTQRPPITRSDQ